MKQHVNSQAQPNITTSMPALLNTALLLSLTSALLGSAPLAQAQSGRAVDQWATVYEKRLPSRPNGTTLDIGVIPPNNVVAVGIGGSFPDLAPLPAYINWSAASGDINSWNLFETTVLDGLSARFGSFALDTVNDRPLVGGRATTAAGKAPWVICEWNELVGWQRSDLFDLGGGNANCLDIAVDEHGNVFATGSAQDAKGRSAWITRRRPAGKTDWSTVDVPGYGNQSVLVGGWGIAYHPQGTLFAVGALLAKANSIWAIRRSTDRGQTWRNVFTGQPGSRASEVAIDRAGNIYVVGRDKDSYWSVQTSSDNGNSWTVVDTFGPYTGARAVTTAPSRDGSGPDDVYVCGLQVVTGQDTRWIVRRLPHGQGNASAQISDEISSAGGASASAICADASGHIFVAGLVNGPEDDVNWWVRRLTLPSSTQASTQLSPGEPAAALGVNQTEPAQAE